MKASFIAGTVATALTAALLVSAPASAQSALGGTGSALRADSSSVVGLGSTEAGGYRGGFAYGNPAYGYGYGYAPYYSGRSVVVSPTWGPRGYAPYLPY